MTSAARAIGPALTLACLLWAGTALAAPASEPSARLHVAFVPDLAGARTTVEMSLSIAPARGRPSPSLRSLALRLPQGMGVATTTLGEANCEPASLFAAGLSGCSANALLGFGTATAVVPVPSGNVVERAELHPLMGPSHENQVEVLFYVQANTPVFAQLVLPATLAEDAPPYGEQLLTSVPLIEVWPEGPDLALRSIDTTIGPLHLLYHRRVGSKTVSFRPRGVRIPRRCPRGGFPFGAVIGFVGGTSTSAEYRVPCP